MRILLYSVFSLFLLTACATSYQSSGLMGGYQEKQISSDVILVSFKGNGLTSIQKTYSYAMKRAAEVTLKNGYSYFEVLDHRNYYEPQTSYTTSGKFTTDFPISEVKIKMLKTKTAKAYDANKVFAKVND